ncbi:hypothetical protein AA19596_1486 [Acetobacter fabarum DSM 19596]|nr:hypothetical protein AA19596_1486 [Acetobacter fabarum DSM 19596]
MFELLSFLAPAASVVMVWYDISIQLFGDVEIKMSISLNYANKIIYKQNRVYEKIKVIFQCRGKIFFPSH